MKLLLLGAASFSGYRLYELLQDRYHITGTFNHEKGFINTPQFIALDIGNFQSVIELLDNVTPDVIINFISLGNVDECEANQPLAKQLNYDFIVALVNHLNHIQSSSTLVHFSSNAVYDGLTPPYDENAKPNPINYYGLTKMWADQYVAEYYPKHILIRPITMIGINKQFQRNNPLTTIYQKLIAHEPIGLVDDVFVNFLFVDDMLHALEQLVRLSYTGTLNISGDEVLSWYQLGERICSVLGFPVNTIARKSIKDFPALALRPLNTSLNNSLIKKITGFQPTPLNEIIRMLGAIRNNKIIK